MWGWRRQSSVAIPIGDLDADGVPDLVLANPNDDGAEGGGPRGVYANRGGFFVIFLTEKGQSKRMSRVTNLPGGINASLPLSSRFGTGFALLGRGTRPEEGMWAVDTGGIDAAAPIGPTGTPTEPVNSTGFANSTGSTSGHNNSSSSASNETIPTPITRIDELTYVLGTTPILSTTWGAFSGCGSLFVLGLNSTGHVEYQDMYSCKKMSAVGLGAKAHNAALGAAVATLRPASENTAAMVAVSRYHFRPGIALSYHRAGDFAIIELSWIAESLHGVHDIIIGSSNVGANMAIVADLDGNGYDELAITGTAPIGAEPEAQFVLVMFLGGNGNDTWVVNAEAITQQDPQGV